MFDISELELQETLEIQEHLREVIQLTEEDTSGGMTGNAESLSYATHERAQVGNEKEKHDEKEYDKETTAFVATTQKSVSNPIGISTGATTHVGAFRVSQGAAESTEVMSDFKRQGVSDAINNENSGMTVEECEQPFSASTTGAFSVGSRSSGAPGAFSMDVQPSYFEHDRHDATAIVAVKVEEGEAEERALRRILDEAVEASFVESVERNEENPSKKKKSRLVVAGVTLLLVIVLAVGLGVGLPGKSSNNHEAPTSPGSVEPSGIFKPSKPTLQLVRERGYIRCGGPDVFYHINFDPETGERIGFEVELCRAIAAGIFGNRSKIEMIDVTLEERFISLANGSVDLLNRAAPTMGRDIYEPTTGVGFTFSTPIMYGGVAFGGVESFVNCANALDFFGDCRNLTVCAAPGTTHYEIAKTILPTAHLLALTVDEIIVAFTERRCNVIIAEVWSLAATMIERQAFGPGMAVSKEFSFERISLMTRDDDREWSDMIDWIVMSLIEAERRGITKENAEQFGNTSVFGDEYKDIFVKAIGAVGNYGELYEQHLSKMVVRRGMNLLQTNRTTGVFQPEDLTGITDVGPGPTSGGALEHVVEKGYLSCGIVDLRTGFADFDESTGDWSGFDVDFCRALSSSVFFGGVGSTIRFIQFEGTEVAYQALLEGSVDVVVGQRVTLGADISGYGIGDGLAFSHPYFYGDGDENRALATRQLDPQWVSFMYWIVQCTIYAEANGITQKMQNNMPAVELFGAQYRRMFRDAILVVGNYGEIYNRNLGSLIPRSGLNLLNIEDPLGPQNFPLPFSEVAP